MELYLQVGFGIFIFAVVQEIIFSFVYDRKLIRVNFFQFLSILVLCLFLWPYVLYIYAKEQI